MTHRTALLMLILALPCGCGPWPDIDTPPSAADAPAPSLLPTDQILAAGPATPPDTGAALSARARELQGRADVLRAQ